MIRRSDTRLCWQYTVGFLVIIVTAGCREPSPNGPAGCPASTIGAGRLNDRVRDGTGCGPAASITRKLLCWRLALGFWRLATC